MITESTKLAQSLKDLGNELLALSAAVECNDHPQVRQEIANALRSAAVLGMKMRARGPASSVSIVEQQRLMVDQRREEATKQLSTLTPREIEVLQGLIAGGTNKDIARKLRISPRTVENHRANMRLRLNAGSIAEMIRIGLYAGLGR